MEIFILKDLDSNKNLAVFTDHGKALEFRKNILEADISAKIDIDTLFVNDAKVVKFVAKKNI